MRIDSQHQHYPDDDASSPTELVDPTRRRFSSVLVMNKAVQHRGILANAAFVVGLTCGSDFDEELFGTDVCDGSSSTHRRLTNIGHVVRKASPSKLRTLREMAMRNAEIRAVDCPEVAATTEYEVYRHRLEEIEGTEVVYRAVHLYGPADAVHALTKNLSPLS